MMLRLSRKGILMSLLRVRDNKEHLRNGISVIVKIAKIVEIE